MLDAVFTATSAVCVTGLITVDTATYWSTFGEVVILALIQLGGLGIMTVASLMVVLLSRRMGLRARLVAQAQTRTLTPHDVGRVVRNVIIFSLASEAVIAAVLGIRFAVAGPMSPGEAMWHGLFHSVSAFNNAGFSLNADSLVGYVGDAWIMLTVCVAVIVGGLGFPVVFELARGWRHPRAWSVTTKLTVGVTVALLVIGTVVIAIAEHDNPATLGAMPGGTRLLAAVFTATMPRTAGFNAIDIGAMSGEGLLFSDLLMFIGGGSASTAGGIKVTTFGLLAVVLWAEMRGEGRRQRRCSAGADRQSAPGIGGRVAVRQSLCGRYVHPVEHDRLQSRSGSVRDDLGAEHGGSVHGHHGPSARRRQVADYRVDVRRASGTADVGVGIGASAP